MANLGFLRYFMAENGAVFNPGIPGLSHVQSLDPSIGVEPGLNSLVRILWI